jgi:citrate synthase
VDQRGFDNQRKAEYLTAREAAKLLGVKLPTLYAYVSRGLVGSIPGGEGPARRYRRSDVQRLKLRADARSGHAPVAAGALRWGDPVLESAITLIAPGGPYYRGVSAPALARAGTSFEAVAELLWSGALPAKPVHWDSTGFGVSARQLAALLPRGAHPLDVLALAVPALGAADGLRFAAAPEAELARARVLVRRMAASLALPEDPARVGIALSQPKVAGVVAVALGARPTPRTLKLIDLALVLSADHELNTSAFAARVAASSGADLYACVSGALAALSGPRHGRACDRVEALIAETAQPGRAAAVLRERAARGEQLPGFEAGAYPSGDPRTAPLLEAARTHGSARPAVKVILALVDTMRAAGGELPAVDAGLVALAATLELPPGSGAALFAIGRSVGWIAHILEQRTAGVLLRPRAQYIGPPPSPGSAPIG